MNFKRKVRKMWRWFLKRLANMKASTKRAILVFIIGIVLGCLIGNKIGGANAAEKAAEEHEKVVKELKDEHAKKVSNLEGELEEALKEEEVVLPWYLVLVNDKHPMEEGYVPELVEVAEDRYLDARIKEAAQEMLADAKAAGLGVYNGSFYRSVDDQARIFNYSMEDERAKGKSYWQAYQNVALYVAEPGTSEHALGLAMDLTSNVYVELDKGQENTAEYKWFKENCYKYGFILRYPPDTAEITGIEYEPWHYRYVGIEDATKITELGITLEEYLEGYYDYK